MNTRLRLVLRLRRPPIQQRGQKPPGARRSLTAAAAVLSRDITSSRVTSTAQWQEQAWTYYDTVDEFRSLVSWVSNALSRMNLVAAIPPAFQGDEPQTIDLEKAPAFAPHVGLLSEVAGGPSGQGQLLASSARQLVIAGIGYIYVKADPITDEFVSWDILSHDMARQQGSTIEVRDATTGAWSPLGESDILIKVHKPHARRPWEPDAQVRACLGSLEEIHRISQRVIADTSSRLAGNGLLVIPTEFEIAAGQSFASQGGPGSLDPDGEGAGDEDDFVGTLTDVAAMALQDQGTAAARVPIVLRGPGEHADKVRHITLWTDLDGQMDAMRESAVKRFARGMDAPPEVITGMAAANHWTAWQISEEAITLFLEPLAELLCHAITVGFYRPALLAAGLDPDSAIVWYDASDLATRPDLSAAAAEAHSRLKLSDAAYLRETGLDAADLPDDDEFRRRILIEVAKGAPMMAPAMLAAAGILPQVVADAAATADAPPPADPAAEPPAADTQPPDRGIPQRSNNAALLAAADVLVVRALEVAGRRLRSAAGKGKPGGAEAVPCDDPALLHTVVAATQHASLEALLSGVWDRVPAVADRFGADPDQMAHALDQYARVLIAAGVAHDYDRMASTVGGVLHASPAS